MDEKVFLKPNKLWQFLATPLNHHDYLDGRPSYQHGLPFHFIALYIYFIQINVF